MTPSTDNSEYIDDFSHIEPFPQGKIFRLTYDNVVNSLRVIAKKREYLEELRTAFSIENPTAFFSKQYGYNAVPRLYLINQFGYFMSGMVFELLKWITLHYGNLDFMAVSKQCQSYINDVITPLKSTIKTSFNGIPFDISNFSEDVGRNDELRRIRNEKINSGISEHDIREHAFEFRDYQYDAIAALLFKGYGRGLIEIPTAGGKSFILSNFIWNVRKHIDKKAKFMILVPNVQLVEQFYKDLIDYGYDKRSLAKFCGGLSKREKQENDIEHATVVIANRQYVFKNEEKLPEFDCLICDEVHSCLAKASQEFICRCKAPMKIGCTGTLPADMYNKNLLIGMFGKIVFKEEVTELQDRGFISKLKITSLQITDRHVESDKNLLFHTNSNIKYHADDFDSEIKFDDAVRAEHDYIAKWHKDIYKPALDYAAELDGNTLILFDKLDIGKNIFEYFKELHPEKNSYYNDGSTDVTERESVRNALEKNDGNVLFANVQIMSVGINIKRLHHVIFAFSGKSQVRVIQSVGRILRLYDGKDYAHLIDISMNTKYSQRHYHERLKLYKQFYNKSKPDETIRVDI